MSVFVSFFFALKAKFYAAFTLYGFDNQERNLIFAKTVFQILKARFQAYGMKKLSIHFTN